MVTAPGQRPGPHNSGGQFDPRPRPAPDRGLRRQPTAPESSPAIFYQPQTGPCGHRRAQDFCCLRGGKTAPGHGRFRRVCALRGSGDSVDLTRTRHGLPACTGAVFPRSSGQNCGPTPSAAWRSTHEAGRIPLPATGSHLPARTGLPPARTLPDRRRPNPACSRRRYISPDPAAGHSGRIG